MKILAVQFVLLLSMGAMAQEMAQQMAQSKACVIAGTHVINITADGVGAIDNGRQEPDRTMKVSFNGNAPDAEVAMIVNSEASVTRSPYDDGCFKGEIYEENLGVSIVSVSPRAQAFLKVQAGDTLLLNCHGQDFQSQGFSLPTKDCKMYGR